MKFSASQGYIRSYLKPNKKTMVIIEINYSGAFHWSLAESRSEKRVGVYIGFLNEWPVDCSSSLLGREEIFILTKSFRHMCY